MSVREDLYRADGVDLLAALRGLSEDIATVMMIGHNPAIADLASTLAGDGEGDVLARMEEKFPTGALATLSFGGSWVELEPGIAYLESFVVPRSLPS